MARRIGALPAVLLFFGALTFFSHGASRSQPKLSRLPMCTFDNFDNFEGCQDAGSLATGRARRLCQKRPRRRARAGLQLWWISQDSGRATPFSWRCAACRSLLHKPEVCQETSWSVDPRSILGSPFYLGLMLLTSFNLSIIYDVLATETRLVQARVAASRLSCSTYFWIFVAI